MNHNIKEIKMKDNMILEATFFSGDIKDFCVSSLFEKHPEYKVLEANKDLWENAVLLPQGSGVYFNDDLDLTVEEIWRDGKPAGKAAVEPRYAIAYAISSSPDSALCIQTVKQLHERFHDLNGTILHSDLGSSYMSAEYRSLAESYGLSLSTPDALPYAMTMPQWNPSTGS